MACRSTPHIKHPHIQTIMDVKTRHYQQLSHQLGKLQENISQSNQQFKIAAEQLQQMQKLSISHASQSIDPSLRGIPFAVQQKHILCTVSYEARARGVKKLGSLSEARKICPEIQTVNGEDLTLYRAISRNVFAFLSDYLGTDTPIQKLGLDEYFIDITRVAAQPREQCDKQAQSQSHTQTHLVCAENRLTDSEEIYVSITADIRRQIYTHFQLTCSAGISNSVMLSKLVGNLHKPDNQTLLNVRSDAELQAFLDPFPLRKLHGFGRVVVDRLASLLGCENEDDLTVHSARTRLSLLDLEEEFGSRLGARLYHNLRGIDETVVKQSDIRPQQISIEDSSGKIDSAADAWAMLESVTERLVRRLDEEYATVDGGSGSNGRSRSVFELHPSRVRVSTRRTSTIPNTRVAAHVPESLSSAVGVSLFDIDRYTIEERARRLCRECLYSLTKKLYDAGVAHGANKLRVINVAFTDFVNGPPPAPIDKIIRSKKKTEVVHLSSSDDESVEGSEQEEDAIICPLCHAQLMSFTVESHMRFHELGD
ncbi:hypothetical protein E3P84_01511 [Wallemia ichthyophaga]|nr:hypothetical protein E3P91_02065 [Wallemia ichthyophaga]TIA81780.1 hypothetical protein E3P98_01869 [Wallemia ichthyophaga]TIB35191.1 hypothetical protein E3P84_01511 [Wallemia ichthyophaga]TIB42039.1 hypothetical protein E3P83_01460 [Wallemia ichthyophaga]TIB63343.1 hypothetical protein E3P78_01910 [Wallemia ichthyophaga]